MGRVKSELPKASFALQNYPNAKGEQAIYLRYWVQSHYARRSTDIWVKPEDWDPKAQEVKPKNKSAARINNKLKLIRKEVDDQIMSYHEGKINYQVIQKMLDKAYIAQDEKAKATYFVDYANMVNELCYHREDYGYTVYYGKKRNIAMFDDYITTHLGLPPITLDQLTLELIDKYVEYRKEIRHNKSNEGINKTLVPLVEAIKYARDNGVLKAEKATPIIDNTYLDLKDRKYDPDKLQRSEIKYLTEEQLADIQKIAPRLKYPRTREILDMFFFSYYACGLRVSDIMTLEWRHIDFDRNKLSKVQVKSKVKGKVSPTIPEPGLEILKRWQKLGRNARFVFDLLPEDYDFSDQKRFLMKRNAVTKTLDTSLKTVGDKIELPFNLTMHVARHTFCVQAIAQGVSLHVISQLMGHQSILATEKTYADFLDEYVDTEMDNLKKVFSGNREV